MEKELKRRVMIITFDDCYEDQRKIMAHFTGIHNDFDYRTGCYTYDEENSIETATLFLYSTTETAEITSFEGVAEFLDEHYPHVQYSIHEHTYKGTVDRSKAVSYFDDITCFDDGRIHHGYGRTCWR